MLVLDNDGAEAMHASHLHASLYACMHLLPARQALLLRNKQALLSLSR